MSAQYRHAKRRDPNEKGIVAELRKAGASVKVMDEPVDLLVGYRGRNYLIEVKSPAGPRGGTSGSGQRLNDNQEMFFTRWRGQVDFVTTAEGALILIGAIDGSD